MAERRSPGEGSTYQRADGRRVAAIHVNGKRRVAYPSGKRDAATKLFALRQQALAEQSRAPSGHTVSELIDKWLGVASLSLKSHTLFDYRYMCNLYVLPAIGDVRLGQLTACAGAKRPPNPGGKNPPNPMQIVHRFRCMASADSGGNSSTYGEASGISGLFGAEPHCKV